METPTQEEMMSAESMWDSESRNSPYCTVWSPVQDNEEQWERDFQNAIKNGATEFEAIDIADAKAWS